MTNTTSTGRLSAVPTNERTATAPPPPVALAAAVPLLREVGDLKRVRVAGAAGSMAERAFTRAWSDLMRGESPQRVADRECAAALAGARLAGVDAAALRRCGLSAEQTLTVLHRSAAEHPRSPTPQTSTRLTSALRDVVDQAFHTREPAAPVPAFVSALCDQPRAGATCPGRPRLIVEPPESHGDHCWAVAVYGGLLADAFDADPADVFLLGLGHHLHNAVLPDAGFAGETLLGEYLEPLATRLTDAELARLPHELGTRLAGLLTLREHAGTPVARAFHAADVLDRVLQVHHHARAAAFVATQALEDLDLVHVCPVSDFQQAVLAVAEPA